MYKYHVKQSLVIQPLKYAFLTRFSKEVACYTAMLFSCDGSVMWDGVAKTHRRKETGTQ